MQVQQGVPLFGEVNRYPLIGMRQIGDMGSWHMEFMDWHDVIRIQLTFFLDLFRATDSYRWNSKGFFFCSEVHPLIRGDPGPLG